MELLTEKTQDFISVKTDGDVQTVSARDLHEKLESTDRFSKWFERICEYGFVENEDFWCVKKFTHQNQYGGEKELQDYAMSLDMAKQICMLQRSEAGKRYREYFLKLEKAWNSPEMVMRRALQAAEKKVDDSRTALKQEVRKRNALRILLGEEVKRDARQGWLFRIEQQKSELDKFFESCVDVDLTANYKVATHVLFRAFCEFAGIALDENGKPPIGSRWTLTAFTKAILFTYAGVCVKQIKMNGYPVQHYIGLKPKAV